MKPRTRSLEMAVLAIAIIGPVLATEYLHADTCDELRSEIASYTTQLAAAQKQGNQQLIDILQQSLAAAIAEYQAQCYPLPPPPPRPRRGVHVLTQHNDNMRT